MAAGTDISGGGGGVDAPAVGGGAPLPAAPPSENAPVQTVGPTTTSLTLRLSQPLARVAGSAITLTVTRLLVEFLAEGKVVGIYSGPSSCIRVRALPDQAAGGVTVTVPVVR